MQSLQDQSISTDLQFADVPPKRKGNFVHLPEEHESFGYILWSILGGKDANLKIAGQNLNISPTTLSPIIHNKHSVTQQFLLDNKWRDILAAQYPFGWYRNREKFEFYTAQLRERGMGRSPKEPEDRTGIGHTLWRILGKEKAKIGEAAERLKVSQSRLSQLIHGNIYISEKLVLDNQWRETFALYYAEGWRMYGPLFERQLKDRRLKARWKLQKHSEQVHKVHNVLDKTKWRKAVGELVARLFIDDILPHISVGVLKNKENWERIKKGDETLTFGVYKSALCVWYKLEGAKRPDLYARYEHLRQNVPYAPVAVAS